MEKAPDGRILLSSEEIRNLLDELSQQQTLHGDFVDDSALFPAKYIGEGNTEESPKLRHTFYRHYTGRLRRSVLSFEGLL